MSLWYGKKENFLSSFLKMFKFGLWLKLGFIAMTMVSWSGILVETLIAM